MLDVHGSMLSRPWAIELGTIPIGSYHLVWFDWVNITKYYPLTESFVIKYQDLIEWKSLLKREQPFIITENLVKQLTNSTIEKLKELEWLNIAQSGNLSEAFILENIDTLNILTVLQNAKINYSASFLCTLLCKDSSLLAAITSSQIVDEQTIELLAKYSADVYEKVSWSQDLSYSFIQRHMDEFDNKDLECIIACQNVPVDFILEHKDVITTLETIKHNPYYTKLEKLKLMLSFAVKI